MLLLAMVVSSISLSSCGSEKSKNPERPDDIPEADTSYYDLDSDVYRVIKETDNVKFEFNDLTTDIRLTNKKTGYSWSTEYDGGDDFGVMRGEVFNLTYYTTTGAMKTMLSSDDSVAKGQFRITDTENGVSVQYGVGDINYKIDFPLALSVERYDNFFNNATPEQQEVLKNNYTLYDFDDEQWQDEDIYDEAQLAEIKNNHPLALNEPWYYMSSTISDFVINELHQLFAVEFGYTEDELKKDNDGVSTVDVERAEFNVQIDYTMEGDNLRVDIPEDKLYFPEDFTLDNIQLHQNLLDFDTDTSGYYLLPDGSGSLMNFNNGRDSIRNESVYVQIYGVDDSREVESKSAYFNDAILPVYGCTVRGKSKASNAQAASVDEFEESYYTVNPITELAADNNVSKYNGLFAVIESGETFTGLLAQSASDGAHNRLIPEFRINECLKMDSFASTDQESDEKYSKYQFQHYLGKISVVYHLSEGEDATYSGMANYYRNQLFGDEKTEKKDYYSTVETVGVINGNDYILGIKYNKKVALTTFDQTLEIAKDLKANGFENMNIRLTGWCNGGYEHGLLDNIKISKELGGSEEFTALKESLESESVGLFPDVDYQYVYTNEESVRRKNQCATLNGSRTTVIDIFDPVDFQSRLYMPRAALTIPVMQRNLDSFLENYSAYNNKNLSLRSIGDKITANYREDDIMERQETLENLVKQIAGVKEQDYTLMGTSGQAPFLPYLDYVNNLPITSAGYDKTDYSVPFAAMVLSGHVQYTGDVINLSNSDRLDLLQMIESGAGAYYTLTAEEYEDISYSEYEHLYSTKYDNIKQTVIDTYKYLSGALSDVYGLSIVKHKILADGVNMVTYENGTSIVVNYNDADYSAKGVTCKAKDYSVIKGA